MKTFITKNASFFNGSVQYNCYYFVMAGNIPLIISMNKALDSDDVKNLQCHIPGLIEMPEEMAQKVSREKAIKGKYHIIYSEGEYCEFLSQLSYTVSLKTAQHGEISPDFFRVTYAHARLAWLTQHLCPVHATCVGYEGNGYVLIVGHAGAGKTSATLSYATKKDMQVFSDDTTIVELNENNPAMVAIAGTPSKQERVNIKAIVLININDRVAEKIQHPSTDALNRLFPFFIDTARADVIVKGAKTIFDGVISPEIKTAISKKLELALNSVPTYELTGSLDYVAENISEMAMSKPRGRPRNGA